MVLARGRGRLTASARGRRDKPKRLAARDGRLPPRGLEDGTCGVRDAPRSREGAPRKLASAGFGCEVLSKCKCTESKAPAKVPGALPGILSLSTVAFSHSQPRGHSAAICGPLLTGPAWLSLSPQQRTREFRVTSGPWPGNLVSPSASLLPPPSASLSQPLAAPLTSLQVASGSATLSPPPPHTPTLPRRSQT